MKDMLGMNTDEMHEVFAEWNKGDLDSYLIEITRIFWLTRTKTINRLWNTSSIPPAKKAPANGPALPPSNTVCLSP